VRFLAAFLDQIDAFLDHELCDSFFYYREVANPFSHTLFFSVLLVAAVLAQEREAWAFKGSCDLRVHKDGRYLTIPLINQITGVEQMLPCPSFLVNEHFPVVLHLPHSSLSFHHL